MKALGQGSLWILPENLSKQEEAERSSEAFRPPSDFGSYKMLRRDLRGSEIEHHNLVGRNARSYATLVKILVTKRLNRNFNTGISLVDIGCGAGFITSALQSAFGLKVTGNDVSADAVEYARNRFPNCNFVAQVIEPSKVSFAKYQLVHSREFYPFTRTNSFEFQMGYLETLLCHVADDGVLILSMAQTEMCILNNLEEVRKKLAGKVCVEKFHVPRLGVFNRVPNYWLSGVFSRLAERISQRNPSYFVVFSHIKESCFAKPDPRNGK